MTVSVARADPDWLALREPADAAARSVDLVDKLLPSLPRHRRIEIHDLGCGTGSMRRWLAPRLPAPQRWVGYDRDAALLAHAGGDEARADADGLSLTLDFRERDITRLLPADLAGADLVTASALLDMFTYDELDRFVASCAIPGCPALLSLSVVGRVDLSPADPLDGRIGAAFNAHQRRSLGEGDLLGPVAWAEAVNAFTRLGRRVLVRRSAWRLASQSASLAQAWLTGWVGAAREQEPELRTRANAYLEHRTTQVEQGQLATTVHHVDLLVLAR